MPSVYDNGAALLYNPDQVSAEVTVCGTQPRPAESLEQWSILSTSVISRIHYESFIHLCLDFLDTKLCLFQDAVVMNNTWENCQGLRISVNVQGSHESGVSPVPF